MIDSRSSGTTGVRRRDGRTRTRRGGEVWPQEVPRLVGPSVLVVSADVAAPDDLDRLLREDRRHAGGLRVVEQDDVPGAKALKKRRAICRGDVSIVGRLGLAERSFVAFHAVEPVVDPLRRPQRRSHPRP